MTIVEKIKSECERGTGLPFLYGSGGELNVLLDNAVFPCVYCTLLGTSQIDNENGMYCERANVAIVICDKTEYDNTGEQNEQIISECQERAITLLRSIIGGGVLRLERTNGAQRIYNAHDVLLVGYALNVTLSEYIGNTGC